MRQKIPHQLDQERAREIAKQAASHYEERFARYHAKVDWQSEDRAALSFSAKGVEISGTLELIPGAIEVELKVPMLLRPFSGKARQVVERELRKWTDGEMPGK